MPIRPGQFYASLLLLVCLGTNIAFFPEVREPFLGSEDPFGSVKSALSELDIKATLAEFYPKILSNVGDEQHIPPPIPSTPSPPPVPEPAVKNPDSLPLPTPPPVAEPLPKSQDMPEEKKPEEPKTKEPEKLQPPTAAIPTDNPQTTTTVPKPVVATIQPAVANPFKPVTAPPKPAETVKPQETVNHSASPVWDTVDTVLERPIRYDDR